MLDGTTFSTNSSSTYALSDMNNANGYTDTSVPCYFGMGFLPGYVGIVSQVKFFMNQFLASTFVNNLVF